MSAGQGRVFPLDSAGAESILVKAWAEISADAPPFGQPQFLLPVARFVEPGRVVMPTVWTGGRLRAALCLERRGGRIAALRCEHTPRVELVGDPGAVAELWAVLRDAMHWYALELRGVAEDSPLARELVRCARRDGFAAIVRPLSGSPYFPLEGDIENRLDGKFRRKLRARARKIPNCDFERVSHADPQALADAFELEAAAWKGEAGTAIQCHRAALELYGEWARRFSPQGRLALSFLRSGERRIACHFALEDDSTYYLLKPGYDPDYARFGPGHVLIREAARDARERGLKVFDFLGQQMSWKAQWTQQVRQHVHVLIYRPSPRGMLAHDLSHRVRPRLGAVRRALHRLRDRLVPSRGSRQGR